jgi:hypothetical protein
MRISFQKLFLSGVFLLGIFQVSFAQERALGTWKTFMPYNSSLGVFDAGDKVYSIASKTVFSYEKNTGAIQVYDKVNGLSDIGIKTANYDPASKVLVIAYNNSNIDLIYNGTDIYNINDIKNKATGGAVSINGISFYNGNCFISSDIGVSVIDLDKKEISNTYIIGSTGGQVKVYATTVDGTTIYAATEEGVKHASLTSSNLQDFNTWFLYDQAQNLPKKKATYVAAYNNKVYTVIGSNFTDTLFEFNGSIWSRKYFSHTHVFSSLNVANGNLYFSIWDTVNSGDKGKIDASSALTVSTVSYSRPVGWFESNGISWESDLWGGMFKNTNGNLERIVPDGPISSNVFDLDAVDGKLNIAPGGVDDSWAYTWNGDGFFTYNNSSWKIINQYAFAPLANYYDILCTATSSVTNKTYFGSYTSGVIELDNNSGNINIYDKWNSNGILEEAKGDTARTKISAMASDRYGNIWMGNAGATKPIKLIGADGTWKQFGVPYAFDLIKKIVVDQNDQLWAPIRRGGEGILVWSYNGTLDDPSDDVARQLRVGAGFGGLPNEIVLSLAEDKDGNMWVGTNAGIGVYYCAGSVLTSTGCDADQIKVERDGYIGYLFGTESVRAIAVDAANRKWIGTTNGLWLISDDGKKELLKFTIDNSPLPSNQITDISIDDETGEVFIGTLGGLVSFQGDAIADCSDCDGALVYPNPVKHDYTGPIAIKGLTDNAYVKITDVSGTLVYQGKANGTQMIWDGKGYSGTRVKSGVYLVFSSTDLGKERKVGKILLMN